MNKRTVHEKQPITLAELKKHIRHISERDEEINYRAGKTEEYINEFPILSEEDAQEVYEEVESLDVPRLKEKHIIKIVDFLPATTKELDVILEGFPVTINKENKKKIVDVTEPYKPNN